MGKKILTYCHPRWFPWWLWRSSVLHIPAFAIQISNVLHSKIVQYKIKPQVQSCLNKCTIWHIQRLCWACPVYSGSVGNSGIHPRYFHFKMSTSWATSNILNLYKQEEELFELESSPPPHSFKLSNKQGETARIQGYQTLSQLCQRSQKRHFIFRYKLTYEILAEWNG